MTHTSPQPDEAGATCKDSLHVGTPPPQSVVREDVIEALALCQKVLAVLCRPDTSTTPAVEVVNCYAQCVEAESKARHALSGCKSDGFVMVPKEPTEAMQQAAAENDYTSPHDIGRERYKRIWYAAIEAATP